MKDHSCTTLEVVPLNPRKRKLCGNDNEIYVCGDSTEIEPKKLTRRPRKRKLSSKIVEAKNAVNQMELLGRFNHLMFSSKSGDKRSDDHVNVANELLHSQLIS